MSLPIPFFRFRRFTASALLLFFSTLPVVTAQPSPAAPNTAPGTEANSHRFNLSFPGGPAQALVELLRQASGEPVNALIPPEAVNFTLPAITYRNVTVAEVLSPLRWEQSVPMTNEHGVVFQTEGYEWRLENGIWIMQVRLAQPLPESIAVQPINIRKLLAHYTIDDLTTAIDAAWRLKDTPAETRLLFHAETSLLILRGRKSDIETARNVLQSMITEEVIQSAELTVNVLGSLGQPGQYSIPAGGTIIDAIARAGGVTRLADIRKVIVRRDTAEPHEPMSVNLEDILNGKSPATPLQPGDTIYVKERFLP